MQSTKLQKLVAAYERFGADIADIPDQWAQQLHRTSSGVRSSVSAFLAAEGAPKPSQVASGLEQGLRETPDIIAAVAAQWRPVVAQAFRNAIAAEYPDFFSKDSQRLNKVLIRGHIKTESEFYLVRHFVDTLEGEPDALARLQQLDAMLDAMSCGPNNSLKGDAASRPSLTQALGPCTDSQAISTYPRP